MRQLPPLVPCQPLSRASPTASAALSTCMFRAGQEHLAETRRLFTTSPAALIGTLAHSVVERAHAMPLDEARALPTDTQRISAASALWSEAERDVVNSYRERGMPLRPREWSHYAMKRARAIGLAARILEERTAAGAKALLDELVEEDCVACDGMLVGRLDRAFKTAEGWVIEDLKTGHIRGDDGALLPHYRRQLLIYAYLLHEAVGEWPRTVRIIPLSGEPYEEPLDSRAARDAVAESLADLRTYNALVAENPDDVRAQMEILATPAPETCAWCRVRAWCEPYWAEVAGGDGEPGRRADIQGRVESPWRPGEAMTLRVERPLRTITLGLHPAHLETGPRYLAQGSFIRALRIRLPPDTSVGQADLASEIWWRP